MKSFNQYAPTRIIYGTDALNHLSTQLKAYSPKKILVLYGGGSVVKSGVLEKVTKVLDAENFAYYTKGGVQPNPLLSFALEARDEAIKQGVDFVLAVGGGSVIDTAKGVAIGVANPDMDLWSIWTNKTPATKALPHANILTIAAAGSETSNSAVLTKEETKEKRGLSCDLNRPAFCILNPEFTHTLPKFQVACGVVDIMMHTMDRYFAVSDNNEMTDQIAEALLRVVLKYGKTVYENPADAQATSEIMWAGSLSHVGLTGLGSPGDWTPHKLSHELSAFYDATHGAALATTWNAFASSTYAKHPERFARYARNVFGFEGEDVAIAKQAIDATLAFFKSIDMPITIKELIGRVVTDEELDKLANSCSLQGTLTVGTLEPRGEAGIRELYKSVNK
ncbi:MAG: iron-containing alcohol dehydrogenase [Clostridia bacterium]